MAASYRDPACTARLICEDSVCRSVKAADIGAPHLVGGERMVEGPNWLGNRAFMGCHDSGASVKNGSLPEERHRTRSILVEVSAL